MRYSSAPPSRVGEAVGPKCRPSGSAHFKAIQEAQVESSDLNVTSTSSLSCLSCAPAADLLRDPVRFFPSLQEGTALVEAWSNRSVKGGEVGCEVNGPAGCLRANWKA